MPCPLAEAARPFNFLELVIPDGVVGVMTPFRASSLWYLGSFLLGRWAARASHLATYDSVL